MNWSTERIGNHFDIKHGFAFKGQYFGNTGDYIVVTPGSFYETGGFRERGEKSKFYTTTPPDEFMLGAGDLIIAMTEQAEGLLGSSALVPHDNRYLHNQRIGLVVDLNPQKLDKRFLFYLLNTQSIRAQIRATATGTKVKHTAPKRIRATEAALPPVNVQRRIADILSAYDDLIENNNRRMALLEEAIHLLYREWFVYFRFPGHERVEVVDGVPMGWRVLPLGKVCNVTMGQSPKSEFYNESKNGLPFHQGVKDFGDRFVGHRVYCTAMNRLAEPGEILFSVRAPVGRINLTRDRIVIGRGLCALRRRDGRQSFQWYQLKTAFHKEDLIGGGTIFASVNKKDLMNQSLITPTDSVLDEFEQKASQADQQIRNLDDQNQRLREARDLLLPRLMDGTIPV